MTKLMFEIPSKNVTHMLPIYIGSTKQPKPSCYTVQNHGRGIFELNPTLQNDTSYKLGIKQSLEEAFNIYEKHNAVYPVTITGLKTENDQEPGSHRFCTMDSHFAEYLTAVISGRSAVDVIEDSKSWYQMINVSQYFRFMKYKSGGEHYPHYDSDYTYLYNKAVTKYSVVVYFNDCDSGEIAFIDDKSEHAGDCSDWPRRANDSEIWLKIKPSFMKIVLFPHTLCHTVLPFTDEDNIRYICRGDILFNKVF